jgi:hypothetical protein
VGIVLLFIGVIASSILNPIRAVFVLEVILIPLLIVALHCFLKRCEPSWEGNISLTTIASTVLILLVLTQVATPHASPDHPNSARQYLTHEETSAKAFVIDYEQDQIVTDFFYAQQTIPRSINSDMPEQSVKNSIAEKGYVTFGSVDFVHSQFHPDNQMLLNKSVGGYENVLYRPKVQIYRVKGGGYWKRTWDPSPVFNKMYNRVYSNGGATYFTRSSNMTIKA